MNTTSEEERDALVDRYVNGKLGAEERADFEIRMMDDAELFDEVQLTIAFKHGVAVHAATEPTGGAKLETLSFRTWLRHPLSLAASVLLVVMGLQLLRGAGNTGAEGGALAIQTVLLLELTRGGPPPQLSGPPPYLVQIDVGLGNGAMHTNVVLRDALTQQVILQQEGAQADDDGWLRLVIMEQLEGTYSAVVGDAPPLEFVVTSRD